MKGALAEGVLPGVLRSLYVGRKSGRLHFQNGDTRRTVRFQRGQIVRAESNIEDERLGETLVRAGLLTGDDFQRATEIVVRDGKRLGVVLKEVAGFDDDRLQDALSVQVHEILKTIFSTSDGEFEFEELDGEAPVNEDMTLKVSTGELILEAVDRVRDDEVVRRSLGDLERRLVVPTDPLLRFQKVTLTPTDGYILSRVDGTTTAREVIQMLSIPDEDVCRSLLGLLSTGLVEFGAAPKKREPPRPADSTRTATAPETPAPSAPPPPVVPPPVAARPSPAAAPAKTETVDDRRREILEAWNGLKTRNHSEILGLAPEATAGQVKDAYFRLAKRFHPDVHTDPALADMHDKLEAVFIRLGQAYEHLKSRARDTEAAPPAPAPAAVPPAPERPTPPPPPAAPDPRVAQETLRKAQARFQEGKYWDAIQLVEGVLHEVDGKVEYKARVLLAQCFMKNPNWIRRAEEQLQKVLAKDANHVDANYTLATIYKMGGLKNRAVSLLRKVVTAKPDHEAAQADLFELAPPETEPPPSDGLLKKLFGKN